MKSVEIQILKSLKNSESNLTFPFLLRYKGVYATRRI